MFHILYKVCTFPSNTSILTIKSTFKATCFSPIGPSSGLTTRTGSFTYLGSQNVLEVNEPVLLVRPDDGPIGLKHVALNVLLMVRTDVLDENINTLYKLLTSLNCS